MGESDQMSNNEPKVERRKYKRISKNFILTYHELSSPEEKFEITQLKNISLGGVCFIASRHMKAGTKVAIELKTPYISDTTHLEGTILGAHEKVKNMLYETRVKLDELSDDSKYLLTKLIEFFITGENTFNA